MGKKREEKIKKGRAPCCEKEGVRKGAWTVEEDKILVDFISKNEHGNWRNLPKLAGLLRCGKSCRLRWKNYLRPDIKRGPFTPDEEKAIIHLHASVGNRWAVIASNLPGRTDNDVKNFWNSHLRKRFSNTVINQPTFPSYVDMKFSSAVACHMDQFQSVGFNAPSSSRSGGDYFIRLWNSEIGESFRNINEFDWNGFPSHSQTSSLTKAESNDKKMEVLSCKKEVEEFEAYSDLTKICEFDDDSSSDAMMKLLLDYPVDGNDVGFLEGTIDDVATYIKG